MGIAILVIIYLLNMLGRATKSNLWIGRYNWRMFWILKCMPVFDTFPVKFNQYQPFKEMYYYFQIGNRYFITIDTQVYKLGLRRVLFFYLTLIALPWGYFQRDGVTYTTLITCLRNDKEAEKFRMRQNYWLHELFRSLPKSAPKENLSYV